MTYQTINDEENGEMAERSRQAIDSGRTVNSKINKAEEVILGETKQAEVSPASTDEKNEADQDSVTITPASATQPEVVPEQTTYEKIEDIPTVNMAVTAEGAHDNPPAATESNIPGLRPVPAIDEYGMPLLGHTRQSSIQATPAKIPPYRQPAAFQQPAQPVSLKRPVEKRLDPAQRIPLRRTRRHGRLNVTPKQGIGCIFRMALLAMLAGIVVVILGGAFIVYEYYKIAATLPSVSDLQQRASTFETTRIFDRNGNLLYEILDPNAGRRTFITLDKIAPVMVAATIATEDKSYYSHPGFDWTAIVRAFWQNYRGGGTVSGASTITQQLARSLLLSPEERSEQSYMRKVREALLAAEITRRYTKDQILELYLNEFNYGNLAYGVEAASETYFNTQADKLDLAEASFLAGLPQAPSLYDVYHNREATRGRQKQVLTLMYEASTEEGCIFVSNSPERVCVDAEAAVSAYAELENYEFNPPEVQIRYPHWVTYVRSILETQFDAQTIYRSGFSVYTTLDPRLQDEAEGLVKKQVDSLAEFNATNGALVAIKPSTGEILSMVGSADFYNDAIDGQVNMATSPTRQPGSSIKPITYIAAFEKGWTASTLIWDVPSEFPPSGDPNDPRPPYVPVNYDGRFHGPVTVRTALANSYNIPAVKTLQFVGVYDNPNTPNEDGVITLARKMGITSLTRDDYGLSLTLGGGEVSLLEMTEAYSVIANAGKRMPLVAITRILDHNGNVVYDYQAPAGEQVIRPEHAFIISSILSDNEARTPMFGPSSVLNLPFVVAAKTGTSNDYRDNWTLGYTPDLAVGVWVGNADYSPMQNISGMTGAAPIWAQFMEAAVPQITDGNPTQFSKPSGIVDRVVCEISGTEPSQWCPDQRSEFFAADQLPLPSSQDLWSKVTLDTWTGLRASDACKDFTKEEHVLNVTDPWAIGWIQNDAEGKDWAKEMGFNDPIHFAPARECQAGDPHPVIEFSNLSEGQTISNSPLDINAKIDVPTDFNNYTLTYGLGDNPAEWKPLSESNQPVSQSSKIYSWDLKDIPRGVITLKITMYSIRGGSAERKIHLNMQASTATPTVTPSVTPTPTTTPTGTPTVTPTETPQPSHTPKPTKTSEPTQTDTPIPTSTSPPTPTETPTASSTPSETSTSTPLFTFTPTTTETPTATQTDTIPITGTPTVTETPTGARLPEFN